MRDANARSAHGLPGLGGTEERLTTLTESFGPSRALVRVSVARRLVLARDELPQGVGLRVVAGYGTGAAADLTLVDSAGSELDLGTPVDATPEPSEGACYFDAPKVSRQARANREFLGAPAALYGPVAADRVAR